MHGLVPVVRLAWQSLRELCNTFFAKTPDMRRVAAEGRIVFPGIMCAFVRELGEIEGACGKGAGEVALLAGQGLIWAWYLAVGCALRSRDDAYLTALWQCGRSVTIQLRQEPDAACLMSRATTASEALRVPAKYCTDTLLSLPTRSS